MSRFNALVPAVLILSASPAIADTTRQLDAHAHGTGSFDLAVSGTTIAMELEVPAADIVGFETAAKSQEAEAKLEKAMSRLGDPLSLFVMPSSANCTVRAANVHAIGALAAEDDHDDHASDAAHHDADHAEDHAADPAEAHDHGDADHAQAHHAHEDDGTEHSEFHAAYELECGAPEMVTQIDFVYFETFPNAEALNIQLVTDAGATAAQVTRDAPRLDMAGAM